LGTLRCFDLGVDVMRLAKAVFAVGLAFASSARAEGNSVKGEKLAVERCSRCHVIGDQNPYGGINSTPSFWIFARKPQIYTERLRTFEVRRPHIALKLDLKDREVENILAYVGGLKPD
jgi:mono/diheme cytochrome c family protein